MRFRTNIKDPKEITVLLVSLAIGLATGVGRWELELILTFFVLLWGLEYREREQVTRAMELTVKPAPSSITWTWASTDRLGKEPLASDPRNIDSVEWDQQKNTSYIYQ